LSGINDASTNKGVPLKVLILAAVFSSVSAFAQMHDGQLGNCEEAAQKALNAISDINGEAGLEVVRLSRIGQVERYSEGGERPQYKVLTNTGRGEHACKVISVTYNPEA
jgi:hypothetical protein